MGGAFTGGAQGAEALFQNPAALARIEPEAPSEAAFGYDALIETAYQGAAAYARPVGRSGAFGMGLVYASQAPQTVYTALGDASGAFTPLDVAAGAGYARRVGGVSIGLGLKAIRSTLSDHSGTTAAADFGLLARHMGDLGEGPIDIGVAVSNLGPPLKLGQSADPLPLRARAGALWHASPTFDMAADVIFPVDQDEYMELGAEARFPADMMGSSLPWTAALRAGYDQNRSRGVEGFSGVTFGGGLDFSALRVDYAWVALGALGNSNRVTLAFRF